jgi:hypothetical protein
MNPFLYEEMSFQDKMFLGDLVKHPGFGVFRRMIDDACNQFNTRLIRLNREDPSFKDKLDAYQLEAHVANEICATLIKSIVMHTRAGELEEQVQKERDGLVPEEPQASVVGSRYGSIVTKSRK